MFYVGVVSSFKGKPTAGESHCAILEKLGHSQGRAKRFLDEHTPVEINGVKNRSVVFVLPDSFRLRNDLIQLSIRQYKCTWQTAKFHIYREAALDVMGNKQDWLEMFPEPKAAEPVAEDIIVQAPAPEVPVIHAEDVVLQAS